MIILLDSGPLGLITNPGTPPEAGECAAWLDSVLARNVQVLGPEIVDYEIRRAFGPPPERPENRQPATILWMPTLILCGQALALERRGFDPIIASANVCHLSLFAKASHWEDISVL